MKNYMHFRKMWEQCPTDFPVITREYSWNEKRKREKQLDRFLQALKHGMHTSENFLGKGNHDYFFSKLKHFFKEGLDYNEDQLAVILSPEMINSTIDFVHQARLFDSTISLEGIFQACRNVWIMNGIQFILEVPVHLSPSIFAYSMLYPYTDNFVDDPNIPSNTKREFSYRFAERLKGNILEAKNKTEEKIYELVTIIEKEWDRQLYPEVYNSLLDIHKAQTDSIFLLSQKTQNKNEIFKICVEKGGTSVIADGYLIIGKLRSKQKQFLYDYGAYLQLLDDLQDTMEDSSNGLATCFSSAATKEKLEKLLCQTFHLGFQIMDEVDFLNTSESTVFKNLMKKSIDLFIIEAIVTNHSFFRRKFISKMECYCPFRFSFIKRKNSTLSPYQQLLFQSIEEFALAAQNGVKQEKVTA